MGFRVGVGGSGWGFGLGLGVRVWGVGVGVRVRLPLTLIRPLLPLPRERAWVRPFHLGSFVTISYS